MKAASKGNSKDRAGRQLAVEMLRELGVDWRTHELGDIPDEWLTEAMIAREPNIMRRYLWQVPRDSELETGFLRVLSDYLGANMAEEEDDFLQCRYEGRRHAR
jgi:hypothetical protein